MFALAPALVWSPAYAQSAPVSLATQANLTPLPRYTPYMEFGTSTDSLSSGGQIDPNYEGLECYCVMWLREARGIAIHGDAWTIAPTHKLADAQTGDVLLLEYPGTSHAALITGFSAKGILIEEVNYRRCRHTTREIDLGSESIRGVYRP